MNVKDGPDPAEKFRQALARKPGDAEGHFGLAAALAKQGHMAEAAAHYEHAIAADPRHARAHNNLGNIRAGAGRLEDAVRHYRAALDAQPGFAEVANNLGNALAQLGSLGEAVEAYRRALAARPEFAEAHYNLSALKTYAPDDPDLQMLEDMARRAQKLPVDSQIHMWFALGKAREDAARYDEAFAAYASGNRLKRATFEYDGSLMKDAVEDIVRRYDRAFARTQIGWGWGCGDDAPVFIVGMPRAGTSLVEQILASHSKIHGAGERPYLPAIAAAAFGIAPGAGYAGRLAAAGKKELRAMGEAYVRKLRADGNGARRITDKLPRNFFYAGLIAKILPQARIIHVMRDPLDICFSNYALLFRQPMPFAYDLGELGRYYRQYSRLMAHWRQVLPEGRMMDVRYEDIVGSTEATARRMIRFCGLRWEDSCLAFHKKERPVSTASLMQVRQPIYQTSIGHAARFATHLDPLVQALAGES